MPSEHIRRPLSAFAFCGVPADGVQTHAPRCAKCRNIQVREQSRFENRHFCVTHVNEFLWSRDWTAKDRQ